jgi:DNA-binding beta-propeller fold protein YncE
MKTTVKLLDMNPISDFSRFSSVRKAAMAWGAVLVICQNLDLKAGPQGGASGIPVGHFEAIATFSVTEAPNNGEVAEIVDATPDGRFLIYTDSASGTVGFVDIQDPWHPVGLGAIDVGGEPTSVGVTPSGSYALICVHGDTDRLVVLDLQDLNNPTPVELSLGGQPDGIAIGGDGLFAAIAIENERDEDLNDGEMPQDPPGFLTIVDLIGSPSEWTTRNVALTELANRFPNDPEPEFVSIDPINIAASLCRKTTTLF